MADKISSYARPGLDINSSRNRAVDKADPANETGKQQRPEPAQDSVKLSGQVDNLRDVETRLKDLPDVDRDRVDSLRARLDSGDYEINAERLARKLLRLEQDLG